MRPVQLTPFVLLLAACATTAPAPDAPASRAGEAPAAADAQASTRGEAKAAPVASSAQVLGDAMPAELTPVSVRAIATDAQTWSGKRVAIEGVVTKMCKKKGCWFEVTDGAGSPGVLVTSSRYHIFLNQGSEGRTVVAFGEFKREVQDLEEAKHLAEDAGEPAPTEAPVVLRLVADGVVLR